jgi:hypothetical protein
MIENSRSLAQNSDNDQIRNMQFIYRWSIHDIF